MIALPKWIRSKAELFAVFRPVQGEVIETRHFADRVEIWNWKEGRFKYCFTVRPSYCAVLQDWMGAYKPVNWAAIPLTIEVTKTEGQ